MTDVSLEKALLTGWRAFTSRIGFWLLLAAPSVLSTSVTHAPGYVALKGLPKIMAGITLMTLNLIVLGFATVASMRDIGVLAKEEPSGSRVGHVVWVSFVGLLISVGVIGGTMMIPLLIIKTPAVASYARMLMTGMLLVVSLEILGLFVALVILWPYNFIAAEDRSAIWTIYGKAAELTRGRRGMVVLFILVRTLLTVPARFTWGITEFLIFPVMTLAAAALYQQMRSGDR